ncbi:NAD-dependent epimerase/dehydratase family protein [Paraburkholderia bryophila]|jgi:nucleoside-diphosphate-sugar epimerase|uniref:Nucleoside-diphosphate-sugar epimerase n=1 Tax=Paraburkholderia bryophila TaxID=420952 RepID=A0A329CSS3_9BURK|nr:NAD-dependent epimerase/dehydratase family protein [Paraburkholderia bryophila]RAS37177.1 nucleoside-diphosphate-sugar epimerase [Paraburkholderia bryophila]
MEANGKVGLFGAAGAAGQIIATALSAAGRDYRVVGRSREPLEAAFGDDPHAEIVTWNPDDPVSIQAAAAGLQTVIYLVGVPYDRFAEHPPLMERTLAGVTAAGVERFILIGTVYPYGRARSNPIREDHPREPHTFKGQMRLAQEQLVLAAHGRNGLSTLVLRLPDFYGPGIERSLVNGVFEGAANGTRAQMIGPVDVPHEFIYLPDAGPVVEKLTRTPEAYGRWWHLAGAGTITQREMARQAYALAGRKPKLMIAGKTMLRALGLFNPLMRELVEMNYLMTEPVVMDDTALSGLLGPIAKTSYEEGIRQTFEAAREAASAKAAAGGAGAAKAA